MPKTRSSEMILSGFYLAKFGRPTEKNTLPPERLRTDNWGTAFLVFYGALGEGRTPSSFCNSLKNSRDLFDGHVESGRVGWREEGARREPLALTKLAQEIFDKWNDQDEADVWEVVMRFADLQVSQIPKEVIADLQAELDPASEGYTRRTEGGEKVFVSVRRERDPRLRAEALKFHGHSCIACGFNFGSVYGAWGESFAEVHHLEPLGTSGKAKRETDARTDLAVLCANCHRMVHRKKGKALTVDEIRSRIDWGALREWAQKGGVPGC